MDRIKDSSLMTLEEMKKYRTNNPYQIIDKDKTFEYENMGMKVGK